MRIVIDLQSAQGSHKDRGIGRYSLALCKALVQQATHTHEIFIMLNGNLPETLPVLQEAFEQILPQKNFYVWFPPGPANHPQTEQHREQFLASLTPDIVLLTSLFEGREDGLTTSIKQYHNTPTAVVLYDLIPHIHPLQYLALPATRAWYKNKFTQLPHADLLLAISDSSRREAITHLQVPEEKTTNISGAASNHFIKTHIPTEHESRIRQKYGLTREFIMYTGGTDPRKNIDGLIRAYANLPRTLRNTHQLVVVCSLKPHLYTQLVALKLSSCLSADEIIFTGFVPETDLLVLYNLCKLFVFPSWHEGFGLPVLEAMCCGKAVIAADSTSVPEVLGNREALFPPHDENAFTEKLANILGDEESRTRLEQHNLLLAKQFSWEKTGRHCLDALEAWHKSAQIVLQKYYSA